MSTDHGAMAVAMSALTAVVALLTVAVAAIAMLYAGRAQASAAADAAALAAAVATYPQASSVEPLVAAREAAASNGAAVLVCRCVRELGLARRTVEVITGIQVEVPIFGSVTVRGVSRAEFDPLLWLGR